MIIVVNNIVVKKYFYLWYIYMQLKIASIYNAIR